jgi:predicted O-methyltransferase YrrM
MTNKTLGLSDELAAYVVEVGAREPAVLARLREETAALPEHGMQIAPEQGAFLALLVELTGARRYVEVGTFTGYSSLAVALALPADGRVVCCDVSEEWTAVARRFWDEAGVAERVDLRLAPATETLDRMVEAGESGTYDLAFVDADKTGYDAYYERLLRLVRPGGLIVFDNMLQGGRVLDPEPGDEAARAVRALNAKLA